MSEKKPCPKVLPEASDYFEGIPTVDIVFVSISTILVVIVFTLYLEVMIRHFSRRSLAQRRLERNRPAWILGVYPAFCFTAIIAICVPRTNFTNDLIAALFLSLCLFKFYRQVVWYYGGPEEMQNQLDNKIVELRGGPCCCCCFCLPGIIIDKTALKCCNTMVMQVCVIRPLCAYILTMMSIDGEIDVNKPCTTTTVIWVVQALSTLLAMYGVLLLWRTSRIPLQHQQIGAKFVIIQLILLFANLQAIFIDILVASDVIKCTELVTARGLGDQIHHHLLIVEMFVLMIVARKIYVDRNRKRAYDVENKNTHIAQQQQRSKEAPGGPESAGVDNQAQNTEI